MAQERSAERLIALIAKSTSARQCLALVLAVALVVAGIGCGGGSSDPSETVVSTTSPVSTTAHKAGSSAGSSAVAENRRKAREEGAGEAGKSDGASPGGRHGTAHIVQPKGAPEQAPTPEQVAHATTADMVLQSPAVVPNSEGPGSLPKTYTCDGSNSWPALRWSGVPDGTAELVLYAMNVQPVEGRLFVDWAVAGLDPSLAGIEAGRLPKGAIVGTNSFGKRDYDVCPPGNDELYMFAVYALPRSLGVGGGFDAREVRKQILTLSGDVGLLPVAYVRG